MKKEPSDSWHASFFVRSIYGLLLVGTVLAESLSSGRTITYAWISFCSIPMFLLIQAQVEPQLCATLGLVSGVALGIFAVVLTFDTLLIFIARIVAPSRMAAVMGRSAAAALTIFGLLTTVGALMEQFVVYPLNPDHNYSPIYMLWPGVLFSAGCFLLWYDRPRRD